MSEDLTKRPPPSLSDLVRRSQQLRAEGQLPSVAELCAGQPDLVAPLQQRLQGLEPAAPTAPLPARLGRYRIVAQLGAGGFGVVYRGHDDELGRAVAIKVPQRRRIASAADVDAYLAEARTLATLDHPGIVPVYDLGRSDDGLCYVVSKFVEGCDLAQRLAQGRLTPVQAAEMIARAAAALHHAHVRGLIHRDIKPANILLDSRDHPVIVDFGLALRELDAGDRPCYAGTPAYMSPEQARGEGHRVDARSDIYSLGVVFYQLLSGRRPFDGNPRAVRQLIRTHEPRPPRQLDDRVPRELDRICLKCLAVRAADRYSTAEDLAADLRGWLQSETGDPARITTPPPEPEAAGAATAVRPPSDQPLVRVVPKGLRAFDAGDADFFVTLLPGPRDRDGLPEALRFWKTRIDETDPERTFAVGLIYGPSGCGKSSLVQAGLLPRLAPHVVPVYSDGAAADLEARLLKGLRQQLPELPANLTLTDALAAVRRGEVGDDRKVLLVLDQFEQWLHGQSAIEEAELVQALRQCDGGQVQALILIRADFWMAATRFMHALEFSLLEGRNSAAVDLFDLRHARLVLTAFGRAFGALPESGELTPLQEKFIEQAATGLAEDGKVMPVRLALLAEMMKHRNWTPAALRAVGGAAGVGVAFLEDTFSAAGAPPQHRYHQQAARALLAELLPAATDITRHMRAEHELSAACGYASRPRDFTELLRILDAELRLITPTDPAGQAQATTPAAEAQESPNPRPPERFYQLTHDYLVPALREWLSRKQTETRRGRAELALADRAAVWQGRQENRQLPSLVQYGQILGWTGRKRWSPTESRMMQQAGRYHLQRCALAAAALVLLAWAGHEAYSRFHAGALKDRLLDAHTSEVPAIVADMGAYRRWIDPQLRAAYQRAERDDDQRQKLHASLALLPVDAGQLNYLQTRLLDADPHEVPVIVRSLAPYRAELVPALWVALAKSEQAEQRLGAAAALAAYDPDSPRWTGAAKRVADEIVAVNPVFVGVWSEALRPVRAHLLDALGAVYRERATERSAERSVATSLLADYAAGQPERLAELLMDADEKQFALIYARALDQRERCRAVLTAALDHAPATGGSAQVKAAEDEDSDKARVARRRANAALALLKMGRADKVWPLWRHGPDPTLRSYLIHRSGAVKVDATFIIMRFEQEGDVSSRRALLLSLGQYDDKQLPAEARAALLPRLKTIQRTAADPGLHAAAAWLLRQWREDDWLRQVQSDWAAEYAKRGCQQTREPDGDGEATPRWFVNGQGLTMIVLPGPVEFFMGSPLSEAERVDNEVQHRRRIGRTFALAATTVTVEQYRQFNKAHKLQPVYTRVPELPVVGVSWFEAAAYCNWLSNEEKIPEDQWCYVTDDKGQVTGLKPGYLSLTGYRLPTEAEMEYATRAGSLTSRYFGEADELMFRYAWVMENARVKCWPVGRLQPNDWGFFDMLGNVNAWCQDPLLPYPRAAPGRPAEDLERSLTIDNTHSRILRGGSFTTVAGSVRSAYRLATGPAYRNVNNGIRPARTLTP